MEAGGFVQPDVAAGQEVINEMDVAAFLNAAKKKDSIIPPEAEVSKDWRLSRSPYKFVREQSIYEGTIHAEYQHPQTSKRLLKNIRINKPEANENYPDEMEY